MKNYSVRMIRENMENIRQFPIPKGFAIRKYRPDEGHIWTRIQRAAERYINKVYLDFGFTPDLSREHSQQAWTEVASVLEHPVLAQLAS